MVNNYRSGIGRLATDRYDFQNHVDGYSFKHTAAGIDCVPAIDVNGTLYSTVQTALTAASPFLVPVVVPEATASVTGGIRLAGDISGGTATVPVISGLQGRPILATAPPTGSVLTWDGAAWSGSSLSGDVTGSVTANDVISATGITNVFAINCALLRFGSTVSPFPIIEQTTTASGNGSNFYIRAQATSSGDGGNLILGGGQGSTKHGGLELKIYSTALLGMIDVSGRNILGLCTSFSDTGTNMPVGTGDKVIFIKDAATVPSTGSPTNGSILYSSAGKLYVKQADAEVIRIGGAVDSLDAEYIIGTSTLDNPGYVYQVETTSVNTTRGTLLTLTIPEDSCATIDYTINGITIASKAVYSIRVIETVSRETGVVSIVGTATTLHNMSSGISWSAPIISLPTTSPILIKTGYFSTETVQWSARIVVTIAAIV